MGSLVRALSALVPALEAELALAQSALPSADYSAIGEVRRELPHKRLPDGPDSGPAILNKRIPS